MNPKIQKLIGPLLTSVFIFFLICFGFRLSALFSDEYTESKIERHKEEYDPALGRLNTMDKVMAYCDSLNTVDSAGQSFPRIVSEVIRKKFYHGYSHYSKSTNPIAVFLRPVFQEGATAIVIPDDIVKYPKAACSQQSIVGMEIFQRKGYEVRKVSMYDSVLNRGHFAYEVYYDKSWHYFDTNEEPDIQILKKYNFPSVAFLSNHPDLVRAAYHNQENPEKFQRFVKNHKVGAVNVFPARNAILFQNLTKFLSNFGWLFFGVFLLARQWYRKKKLKLAINHKVVQANNSLPTLSAPYKTAKEA